MSIDPVSVAFVVTWWGWSPDPPADYSARLDYPECRDG